MICTEITKSIIYNELNKEDCVNWFDRKEKKFLHNIDTFYYSVKLNNDFRKDSSDKSCLKLRQFFNSVIDRSNFDMVIPFDVPDLDMQLNIRPFRFARFYNINIECPDLFDIFIADTVPDGADGEDSVTSEIIVQLRSYLLWQYGATKSFEYSYEAVKAICRMFNLEIFEVKENRIDYCWHSNYLQNPEKFFRIDNLVKMQVSRYKRIHYEYAFKPNEEYENDYISMGKRSDKCFLRIYLKSKEVVEQGYKPWFFKEWLFNGLINRYDYYVYEKAFLKRSWKYVNVARLEFYAEYGSKEIFREECAAIISGEVEKSDEYISSLADKLTPRITLITNVEYQTMRKMSKSFELKFTKDNEDKAECRRIYDYLDNRYLITEYLTHSTFRLVTPEGDINKSRRDYCSFWKALRSCRMVDVKKSPKELKLTRDYTRRMNKEIVKKRIINATITYSLYTKGINQDDVALDAADVLLMLNDNDIHTMKQVKQKRIIQLNNMLLNGPVEKTRRRYKLLDSESGELIE